jgi:hypothetical protein
VGRAGALLLHVQGGQVREGASREPGDGRRVLEGDGEGEAGGGPVGGTGGAGGDEALAGVLPREAAQREQDGLGDARVPPRRRRARAAQVRGGARRGVGALPSLPEEGRLLCYCVVWAGRRRGGRGGGRFGVHRLLRARVLAGGVVELPHGRAAVPGAGDHQQRRRLKEVCATGAIPGFVSCGNRGRQRDRKSQQCVQSSVAPGINKNNT